MTKQYAGKELTLVTNITNNGALIDPTEVKFTYRINHIGSDSEGAVTKVSTGRYQTIITPEKPGILYGKWETNGVVETIRPVKIPIHDAQGLTS